MTQMLKLVHNKKRNVGLIFEFFSIFLTKAILEEKNAEIGIAKALLTKHFHEGTDLHKEFMFFKSLFEARGLTNKETALRLMDQVKSGVKLQSQKKLDLEKTSLIHEINQLLNKDGQFFNQNIQEYKNYATIQTLLNEWRNQDLLSEGLKCYFGPVTQLEDQVLTYLTEQNSVEKQNTLSTVEGMRTDEIDGLVVDIMRTKLEEKYSSVLNEEQKEIVRLYTFADSEDSRTTLISRIQTLKEDFGVLLHSAQNLSEETEKKLKNIQESLKVGELSNLENVLNDDVVTFYLGVSSLNEELRSLTKKGEE